MTFPAAHSEALQVVTFLDSHLIALLWCVVFVAQEVQHAVDCIQKQFVLGSPTYLRCDSPRSVRTQQELAIEKIIVVA